MEIPIVVRRQMTGETDLFTVRDKTKKDRTSDKSHLLCLYI